MKHSDRHKAKNAPHVEGSLTDPDGRAAQGTKGVPHGVGLFADRRALYGTEGFEGDYGDDAGGRVEGRGRKLDPGRGDGNVKDSKIARAMREMKTRTLRDSSGEGEGCLGRRWSEPCVCPVSDVQKKTRMKSREHKPAGQQLWNDGSRKECSTASLFRDERKDSQPPSTKYLMHQRSEKNEFVISFACG